MASKGIPSVAGLLEESGRATEVLGDSIAGRVQASEIIAPEIGGPPKLATLLEESSRATEVLGDSFTGRVQASEGIVSRGISSVAALLEESSCATEVPRHAV